MANVKTFAQKNKNLLFLLGAGGLVSFIAWKVNKERKKQNQTQSPIEKIHQEKEVFVLSEPTIQDPKINIYYQERVEALKKIIGRENINPEELFKNASDQHVLCMQYNQGEIPDELSKLTTKIMRDILLEFNIKKNNIDFVLVKPTEKNLYFKDSYFKISIHNNHYKIMINDSMIKSLNPESNIVYFFKFFSDFVDCLGNIVSKKLCLENEIAKFTIIQKNIKFSIQQHLAFLAHNASLFYSNLASEFKTLYLIFTFKDWIDKEDLLFSTKGENKLSFGTTLLSTLDYARHIKKDQKIDILRFDAVTSLLPNENDDLILGFNKNDQEFRDLENLIFNYFRFDGSYQSFDESNGFMKKIARIPDSFEKPIDYDINKTWLDKELQNLNMIGLNAPFNYQSNTSENVVVKFIGNIPDKLQAVMRMFVQRYASKCTGGGKEITIKIEQLDECNHGISWLDSSSKWNIGLAKNILEGMINYKNLGEKYFIFYYFFILETFLHELAHLVNQDSYWDAVQKPDYKNSDLGKKHKIQREWRADQLFSLLDKDVAEISLAKTILGFQVFDLSTSKAGSKIHASEGARALRHFDIAKHYDLIPSEVINGSRNFNFSDMESIFLKHGIIHQRFDEFQNATDFYQNHKNDNHYESFSNPHDDCKTEKKRKERIRYLRIQ